MYTVLWNLFHEMYILYCTFGILKIGNGDCDCRRFNTPNSKRQNSHTQSTTLNHTQPHSHPHSLTHSLTHSLASLTDVSFIVRRSLFVGLSFVVVVVVALIGRSFVRSIVRSFVTEVVDIAETACVTCGRCLRPGHAENRPPTMMPLQLAGWSM